MPLLLDTEATGDGEITITTPGAQGWDTTVVLVEENPEWKLASRVRRSWCGTSPTHSEGCDQAYSTAAIGTRGRFLVAVEVLLLERDEDGNYPSPPTEEILDDTFEVLRAQLDLLE